MQIDSSLTVMAIGDDNVYITLESPGTILSLHPSITHFMQPFHIITTILYSFGCNVSDIRLEVRQIIHLSQLQRGQCLLG